MSAWLVREQGSSGAIAVPSAEEVLAGLLNGNWHPSDEVKGPEDADWQAIEHHPSFAHAAEQIEEPPKAESPDETHLDMNPLIDVCLVLLIFFILTITYASLERSISIPEENPDQKGPANVQFKDIKDKVFVVVVRMDGDQPVIEIEKEKTPVNQVAAKIKQIVNNTGRKEMVVDIDKDVPWGIETAILDAAAGNGIHNIMSNSKK